MKTKQTIKIITQTIILVIAIIITSSCEKKQTQTSIPENLFEFDLVADGKVEHIKTETWRDYNTFFSYDGVNYIMDTSAIIIDGILGNTNYDLFIFAEFNTNFLGTHNANKSWPSGFPRIFNGSTSLPFGSGWYECKDSLPASITITKFSGIASNGAKVNDVVEGTFDMTMINSSNKKIQLRAGKFHLTIK
jgi:hypothetical protein